MTVKYFEISLGVRDLEKVDRPVRNHLDCTLVVLSILKFWNLLSHYPSEDVAGKAVLYVDKMNRLFLESENCIQSLVFPFKIIENGKDLDFISSSLGSISTQNISEALAIFENQEYNSTCIYEFSDTVIEFADNTPGFWGFVRELMDFEAGYVRYDTDPANQRGDIHPLHHLDVFFSSSGTFKLGKDDAVNYDNLFDILNLNSDCWYLKKTNKGR